MIIVDLYSRSHVLFFLDKLMLLVINKYRWSKVANCGERWFIEYKKQISW